MKKITFICPYFGTLPKDIMPLWLNCCKYNATIEWIIFTDDRTLYNYPENVKVVFTTLSEVKKYAQGLFSFAISLDTPYKLCDYKPLYGSIFKDYLRECDFWGHCDISDSIFGNLRKFFVDDILENYDKILFLGHMTLYRNTDEINNRFKIMTKSGIKLEEIFGVAENKAFDELTRYSINTIYTENNFSLKRIDDMYIDVTCLSYPFKRSTYDDMYRHNSYENIPRVFYWSKGELFDCTYQNGVVKKTEVGYVHFQKRKMKKFIGDDCEAYYIVPNGFIEDTRNIEDIIKDNSKSKLFYKPFWVNKGRALKYRIKHMFSD